MDRAEFVGWLVARRSRGDSLGRIGREFGVSRQAVAKWLRGESVSATVLILAGYLRAGEGWE